MEEKRGQNTDSEQASEFDYTVVEFSKQTDKKKRRRTSLILLIFNILVIGAIVLIEVLGNNDRIPFAEVLTAWAQNWRFLVVLAVLVVAYYITLTFKISVFIRAMTGKPRRKLSFSTAILGKYYDNVTPFGSGGQPFQMYNLGRKLEVGQATSIPIADFIINQLVFVAICLCLLIVKGGLIQSGFMKFAAYVGLLFYSFVPLVAIGFSVAPKPITKIAHALCKLGAKIKLVKDSEQSQSKITDAIMSYSSSLVGVVKKWWVLLLSVLISVVGWWALNSMPYFVLRACGVDANYFNTLCMSFFVYASVTVVPTPGNAGAAEGAFYAIFSSLSGNFLFWGTMLWRFCTYYLSLIAGFAVTVFQYAQVVCKEKKLFKRDKDV